MKHYEEALQHASEGLGRRPMSNRMEEGSGGEHGEHDEGSEQDRCPMGEGSH